MDKEEAFRKLGLPSNASRDEINSMFRERAHISHPDKGGDSNEMSELLEARDTALCPFGSGLVSVSELNKITDALTGIGIQNQQIQSHKNLMNQIINERTHRNKFIKRLSLFAGSASALFFFLSNQIGTTDSIVFSSLLTNSFFKDATFIYGLLFGFIYVATSIKVTIIENTVEDINEILRNKKEYFQYLNTFSTIYKELFGKFTTPQVGLTETKFTEHDLQAVVKELLHHYEIHNSSRSNYVKMILGTLTDTSPYDGLNFKKIVKNIGLTHFTCLFISKGIEMGILNEHEKMEGPVLLVQYSLTPKYSLDIKENKKQFDF